jgi:hypothetical protein
MTSLSRVTLRSPNNGEFEHHKYGCHIGRRAKQIQKLNLGAGLLQVAAPSRCWENCALSQASPKSITKRKRNKCQIS